MSWTILKNDAEYYVALDRLEEIFHATSAIKLSDEFDLLTLLINKYEEEKFPIKAADPIQVIKMKLDYMGFKQKDLIPFLGSKSTVSKILSYKSPLTLKHIWLLSRHLDLPIQLLAKPYKIENWSFMKKFENQFKSEKNAVAQ